MLEKMLTQINQSKKIIQIKKAFFFIVPILNIFKGQDQKIIFPR